MAQRWPLICMSAERFSLGSFVIRRVLNKTPSVFTFQLKLVFKILLINLSNIFLYLNGFGLLEISSSPLLFTCQRIFLGTACGFLLVNIDNFPL